MAGVADAAVELLSDPERRARLGRKARTYILDTCSMDRIADQYEALYQALFGGGEDR